MSENPGEHDHLRRFLVRAVLDDGFRELARTDPDRAMVGFDLTNEQRDVLRRQEADVLGLLGQALRSAGVTARPSTGSPEPAAPPPPSTELPAEPSAVLPETIEVSSLREMRLMLRLVPAPVRTPEGAIEVRYAASLHPLPAEETPAPEPRDPAEHAAPVPVFTPRTADVPAAVEGVRNAAPQERLARLVELARVLQGQAP